jgi:hypothetical protein
MRWFWPLFFFILINRVHALNDPDFIGFVKSDEPGYQTVILRWSNRTYELKVKGKIQDPENKAKYNEFFKHCLEVEDENVRDR